MAIEQNIITDKFKAEGIDENLAANLTFEDEGTMNSFIESYKGSLPKSVKGIEEYTREEIEELTKDPQFKGAKGLQGYLDQLKSKQLPKPQEPVLQEPQPAADSRIEALETQLKEMSTGMRRREVSDLIKSKYDMAEDVQLVLARLGGDFSEANVTAQLAAHEEYKKKLIPNYLPGGATPQHAENASAKYGKALVESKKKK